MFIISATFAALPKIGKKCILKIFLVFLTLGIEIWFRQGKCSFVEKNFIC